jgi:hypothetical protein
MKTAKVLLSTFALLLISTCVISAQIVQAQAGSATVGVDPNQNTSQIGQTLNVNITIDGVENLYGLDLTVAWDNTILSILSATPNLGAETYHGGVLHEASNAPITIIENNASQPSGWYRLAAFSQNPASSFNGSGIIAMLTFNTTKVGASPLTVFCELADRPPPDETSELIDHLDVSGSVEAVIPEFPNVAILGVFLVVVAAVVLFSKKMLKKPMAFNMF